MADEPTPKKFKAADLGAIVDRLETQRQKASDSVATWKFNKKLCRVVSSEEQVKENSCGIIYWMQRDQRVQDNWAFLFAQKLALKNKLPLHVCFCLLPSLLDSTLRHYHFILKGLAEVANECSRLDIPFHLLRGKPSENLVPFVRENKLGCVVTDFSPLRLPAHWLQEVQQNLPNDVPLIQVDAHNVVPCWVTSDKQEYGARTIRKKIHDKLKEFLTEFPPLVTHPYPAQVKPEPVDWDSVDADLQVDRSVSPVDWATPGTSAGLAALEQFCEMRLKLFADKRNDPTVSALSNLSPWIHFGHISVQRCILEVRKYQSKHSKGVEAFIEEAVVRRELADNYCFYQPNYDRLEGASDWARKTLADHRKDKREYVYTRKELEEAKTHDDLWNAAQVQLVKEGKMHGFLRMYWAKKILEWTASPEEALSAALYLNDHYSLDGTDPNGYVGCMWSICGLHDQGWAERSVFGKIRFMNYKGCQRKFDVNSFIARYGGKKCTK